MRTPGQDGWVALPSRHILLHYPTFYLNLGSGPKVWISRPFWTVSSIFNATLLAYRSPLPPPPDEAFAAKHMPDLGHEVKEFQVYHWKLQGWKKLGKKLISPEFDCGGHAWYVAPGHRHPSHSYNLQTHSGRYFSSRPVIATPPRMTPPLSISIAPTPTQGGEGTLVPNLRWSSRTPTILPFIPSAVRRSQLKALSFSSQGAPFRRTSPIHRRRVRLGFHPVHCGEQIAPNSTRLQSLDD